MAPLIPRTDSVVTPDKYACVRVRVLAFSHTCEYAESTWHNPDCSKSPKTKRACTPKKNNSWEKQVRVMRRKIPCQYVTSTWVYLDPHLDGQRCHCFRYRNDWPEKKRKFLPPCEVNILRHVSHGMRQAPRLRLYSVRHEGFSRWWRQLFLTSAATFLDDVKEWSGPCLDAHQLGVRLNSDVDVKILLSLTSREANVKTAVPVSLPMSGCVHNGYAARGCSGQVRFAQGASRVVSQFKLGQGHTGCVMCWEPNFTGFTLVVSGVALRFWFGWFHTGCVASLFQLRTRELVPNACHTLGLVHMRQRLGKKIRSVILFLRK